MSGRLKFSLIGGAILACALFSFFGLRISHREGSDGTLSDGSDRAHPKGTSRREPESGEAPAKRTGPKDTRLARLFEGDKTGFSLKTFNKYLAEKNSKGSAVLACYLLSDNDPELLKMLTENQQDGLVKSLGPFLDQNLFTAPSGAVATDLARLDPGNSLLPVFEMGSAVTAGDMAKVREHLEAMGSGSHGLEALKSLNAEMRDALAAIGISGTKAEILIDQKSVKPQRLSLSSSESVSQAWKLADSTLARADRIDVARQCIQALSNNDPSLVTPTSLLTESNILKALPQDALIDGKPVADRIAEIGDSKEQWEKRASRVNDAFLNASPGEIDRFYQYMATGDSVGAEESLLKGPE